MSFSLLVLDFHNTIYDEALEYGFALEKAAAVWLEAAPGLTREQLYAELSQAHRALGSDWDEDAWALMPSLNALPQDTFRRSLALATQRRRDKSRELTVKTLYPGVRETLTALKHRSVRICVVTEAAADAGMIGLQWLGLAGIVDGFYSYPSRGAPAVLEGTYHKPFPPGPQGHLRKPHPFVLAAVALDETIRRGSIPANTQIADVFTTRHESAFLIAELPPDAPAQQDIAARLVVKDTPHLAALKHILDEMLYVGDSKFRDGMLARNASVAFGYAAYGKKGQDSEETKKSIAVMVAATGWDKDVMKLTQEAGRSQAVNALEPDFTFKNSLSEAMELFI